MKKLIIFLSFISFISSCKKSDDNTILSGTTTISGLWKITSYIDNKSRDRTSNYSGNIFDFGSTGILVVNKSSTQYKGTYATVIDSGKEKFVINITTSDNDLAELNDDWLFIERTSSKIKLTNTSGGNGGTKTLIFSK